MTEPPEQPTLTDGDVTLRPWRDADVADAVAGHDELIAHWFGWPADAVNPERMQKAIHDWRATYADDRSAVGFAVEDGDGLVGSVDVRRREDGVGELSWALFRGRRGHGVATRAVRLLADYALTDTSSGGLGYSRVEAKVEPGNEASLRVATRSGLRREGERRIEPGTGDRDETTSYVVLARLASDPPITEPTAFRALLNSFLPRKRAISQLLVRDRDGRVLICQLTYKRDWDLPGGVVEVGESPREARRARDRGGARAQPRPRRPAAHRLAPALGRLGRRGLPRLRRRPARREPPRPDDPRAARDPARRVRDARAGARTMCRLHRAPDRLGAGRRAAARPDRRTSRAAEPETDRRPRTFGPRQLHEDTQGSEP